MSTHKQLSSNFSQKLLSKVQTNSKNSHKNLPNDEYTSQKVKNIQDYLNQINHEEDLEQQLNYIAKNSNYNYKK